MTKERYIHPLDTDSNIAVGVDLPLTSNTKTFFALNYTTQDQAKANLKNLILTNKGERIMLPDYGCNLKKMLFEQVPDEKIKETIEVSVEQWLPYINIIELIVKRDPTNEYRINIDLYYNILEDEDTADELSLELSTV